MRLESSVQKTHFFSTVQTVFASLWRILFFFLSSFVLTLCVPVSRTSSGGGYHLSPGFLVFLASHFKVAGAQASRDPPASASHVSVGELTLQTHAPHPTLCEFWGSKHRSLCLYGKHFTHGVISPVPKIHSYLDVTHVLVEDWTSQQSV